ncbi:hypothetical protein Q8A67_023691 [Cirrhinus molitorella]|uniref:C-type lectin domain-containing protein n=2 Tax=Cirrhinus molitorella TaxID=172907 RepID=A0AA88TL56_9TELE|nr:hypothetical protein Q8A67_023691 [Cirrhinus molitorella]
MSDGIYDNVIRTETEGENRERVEMTVAIYESADCVKEHDFRTETNTHQPPQHTGDSVKVISSRAAVVCLVLLCVLLLTAVIVLYVYIDTNYTVDRDELQTKITNLTEERDQLLITNKYLKTEKDQLEIQNQKLTNEKRELSKNVDQLQQKNNDLQNILQKMSGCTYYKSRFYFISSEKKSWSESRQDCKDRGADLIIINNKEKQDLVKQMSVDKYVWIGLTDIDVEGKWKWVNGSSLTSGFWNLVEPNGHRGENCVVSYTSKWYDYPCNDPFHSICEKSISNE